MDNFDFASSIIAFNDMYKLPVSQKPTINVGVNGPVNRLLSFKHTLTEELQEIDAIIDRLKFVKTVSDLTDAEQIEILTELADLLGDIQVYCASEMAKFGLPIESTLRIIMQSNMSKQFDDGPHYDDRGKVLKGPNYYKPEPEIKEMLKLQKHKQQETISPTEGLLQSYQLGALPSMEF